MARKKKADFVPEVTMAKVADLVPYEKNSRTHSPEQIAQIAVSIEQFGFVDPCLVDGKKGLIAGHGRVMAAQDLGIEEVPVIEVSHLTKKEKRLLVIAHNRIAQNAGWDFDILRTELAEIASDGFDVTITGFSSESLLEYGLDFGGPGAGSGADPESPYTQKVKIPVYEPSEECPELKDLIDRTKADALQAEIKEAGLPADVEKFLLDSAERFVEFQFDKIADFYAHASPEIQNLMENSALVIVDYQKAIELGFVKLKEDIDEAFFEDHPDA